MKLLAIAGTVVISGGLALHAGHEPKCLMKTGIVKQATKVQTGTVAANHQLPAHQKPVH